MASDAPGRIAPTPPGRTGRQPPRLLHAGAWWVWAIGLAAAASQTTNPILLVMLMLVAAVVVQARRPPAPRAAIFTAFVALGAFVLVMRLAFAAVFGSPVPSGTVLFTLPELTLPDWAAGVTLGGPVSLEGLVLAFYQGLQLLTVLVAVGAANALADARRLLRSLPGALYEVGVAVVVALTFTPRLVADTRRVRRALRLRGRDTSGVRGVGRVAPPVLEGALDSALDLAAAMDSRGFGRRAAVPARWRTASAVLVLLGMVGILAGVYGLMAGRSTPLTGSAALVLGCVAAVAGTVSAGRHTTRTRYRPDPWAGPEWAVALSGIGAAVVLAWAASVPLAGMNVLLVPLVAPEVPVVAVLGVLLAASPALTAPALPIEAVAGVSRVAGPAGVRVESQRTGAGVP
jgi:energy-coupling factor transport system permease protein